MRISQWVQGMGQQGVVRGMVGIGLGGVLAAAVLGAPVRAAGPESQPAVWTEKQVHFVYSGFTTHYSCDGLRDQVFEILLQLGARKEDLKVRESGCTRLSGRPEPFPGVDIKMHVLTPAAGAAAEPVVGAHWKSVDLLRRHPALDAAGQCELYDEVKHTILPAFTVRNLDFLANCVPHQLSPGGQRLEAEVLVPDQPGAPPAKP